jgi:hypothetical protein
MFYRRSGYGLGSKTSRSLHSWIVSAQIAATLKNGIRQWVGALDILLTFSSPAANIALQPARDIVGG